MYIEMSTLFPHEGYIIKGQELSALEYYNNVSLELCINKHTKL